MQTIVDKLKFVDTDIKPLVPITPPATHFLWMNLTRTNEGQAWMINGHKWSHPRVPLIHSIVANQPFHPDFLGFVAEFPLNSVIDIRFSNIGVDHPFHIHGYKVFLLGVGSAGTYSDSKLNLVDPLLVDTWYLPLSGWAVIRLVADNPGPWMIHCVRNSCYLLVN